ncbi:SDR family oxidoreductase [Haloprofundus salilacus]|uniref:SDR family oxidoreductase n=1 Tax=Haloprofundus salilacus TaxID=2876190 RepID=UPI001CC9D637|nr:SDR family oxidoreductase [Haloprofundus salilacus]
MTKAVLVTGATGTVGRHVVSTLSDRPATVRVGLRNPDASSRRVPETADVVEFDFEKPEAWGSTLANVDGLFLVRPPTVDAETVGRFAEAAARVGVAHIVYLSTLGAERNVLIPHHRIEKRIMATEADYTLLRASFFMQNFLEVHRADIVEHNQIFVPAGDGKTSFVDARDLGEAGATVLTERGHENHAYDLTGSEAVGYTEVAAVFTRVLDRQITYPKPSLLEFGVRMRRRGNSLAFIALMGGIYTTARLGLAARVTDDTSRILGREPRKMRTFVEEYADEFRADSETPDQD